MVSQRKYGIDLLRITSMFMVIILHLTGNGGILNASVPFSAQYNVALFLQTACYCAVNCYALISGYVGVNNKFKVHKIGVLWLQVVFYTFFITLYYALFTPVKIYWENAFLPVETSQYWYFTAYFVMFFFTPFFNTLLNTLKEKQLKQLGITIVVFLSVVPTIWQRDIFFSKNGYSFLWISSLYILGGIINKLKIAEKFNNISALLTYFIAVIISFAFNELTLKNNVKNVNPSILTSYISPTILLCALSLLILAINMNIKKKWIINVIEFLSPLSFSVYIIHTNPYIWLNWFKDRFVSYAEFSPVKLFFVVILTALAIFFVCASIDLIRFYLFKFTKLSKRLAKLETNIRLKNEKRKNEKLTKQV